KKEGAEGKSIDVTQNLMYGVSNIIWQLAFGRTLPFGDPMLNVVKDEVHKLFVSMTHPCVAFLDVFPQIEVLDFLFDHPIKKLKTRNRSCMNIMHK
ncbi:hypothetical protein PFISCL1PPCAC_18858, partial [Pristionchus fissidentatus]